jgi:hypothetical protein
MHPWFVPSNNPVKLIFSFICIKYEMLQGLTHSVHFFSILQFPWAPTVRTVSETSNHLALCRMLNHGNHVHCLSLSSCQLKSTLPPAAQLLLSQSQQADLVGQHLRLSNVLGRIYRLNCEPLYVTNISHRKHETFRYEYPLQRVILPTKKKGTTERCSSGVHSSSTVAMLTTETRL